MPKRKRKPSKGHHERQAYLHLFFQNSKRSLAVSSLKSIEDLNLLRNIQKSVSVYSRGVVDEIEGCPFPKDYKQLCSIKPKFVRPVSLNSELVWFCSYAIKYFDEIKWFLGCKKEFEQLFMTGRFVDCYDLLQNVKKRLGVSLWYYEAMFLLYEYWDKRKEGIMLMSDCLKSTQDAYSNYLQSMVYKLHQRTTINLSPFKFDEDLDALFKRNRNQFHEDYYRYFLFRLNFFNNINQEEISFNMLFESVSSLIDRYLMAVNLLKAESVKGELSQELKSRALYLYSKTDDEELVPVMVQLGKAKQKQYYDARLIDILDSYYGGHYEETLEKCKACIPADASHFDVYVIYSRCLVYLGKSYHNILPGGSNIPANKLSRLVYDTLVNLGDTDAVYSLCQMNKNLYGFHLAAAMHVFVKHEMNETVDDKIRALWCNHFDPEFAQATCDDRDEALNYLQSYSNYKDSVICKVYASRLQEEELAEGTASYNILLPHNATIVMQRGEYGEAFKMWKSYYEASGAWLPNRQKAVRNMVKCLFLDKKVEQAISLYVDFLLNDQPATKKVDTDEIIKYLQDNLYEGVRRNIDLAIFMGLNCKDGVDKSFILLEYCETQGVERPADLIGNLDEPEDRQEAFFAIMNDDETLRHYFNIPSLKDRLNERLKIINYLLSLNTQNKDAYLQMQKEVEDALLVYKVSSNLNEGKIYANDQAILKYKLGEIDGLYNRFMQLLDIIIKDKKTFFVLDLSSSTIFYGEKDVEGEEVKSKTSVRENGIYEVFYSLYDYIRDKFLWSEFGLVAYLSTRVRHGELESKLRPELTQRNLILQTNGDTYQPTPYWSLQYNLSPSENTIVNEALTKFSKGFDEEVVNLIKERLQIYDKEKKPGGLFDYETDTNELPSKAMEIGLLSRKAGEKDKEEFCRLMISWLWEKTESSLAKIRHYISGEFTDHINKLFDTLQYDLRPEVLPVGHVQKYLQSAITEASTVIAGKIKNIECWFNISGMKLEDVDLIQLTHQVFNNIETAYPQYPVDGRPEIQGNTFKVKSIYVLHYKDLLTNLITNMLKHGELDDETGLKPITLQFTIGDELLALHFENKVKPGEEEALNKKFEEKLSAQASYYNSEGGSGIAKSKKILKSDLQTEANSITIVAKDGLCITDVVIYTINLKANEQTLADN